MDLINTENIFAWGTLIAYFTHGIITGWSYSLCFKVKVTKPVYMAIMIMANSDTGAVCIFQFLRTCKVDSIVFRRVSCTQTVVRVEFCQIVHFLLLRYADKHRT